MSDFIVGSHDSLLTVRVGHNTVDSTASEEPSCGQQFTLLCVGRSTARSVNHDGSFLRQKKLSSFSVTIKLFFHFHKLSNYLRKKISGKTVANNSNRSFNDKRKLQSKINIGMPVT